MLLQIGKNFSTAFIIGEERNGYGNGLVDYSIGHLGGYYCHFGAILKTSD